MCMFGSSCSGWPGGRESHQSLHGTEPSQLTKRETIYLFGPCPIPNPGQARDNGTSRVLSRLSRAYSATAAKDLNGHSLIRGLP